MIQQQPKNFKISLKLIPPALPKLQNEQPLQIFMLNLFIRNRFFGGNPSFFGTQYYFFRNQFCFRDPFLFSETKFFFGPNVCFWRPKVFVREQTLFSWQNCSKLFSRKFGGGRQKNFGCQCSAAILNLKCSASACYLVKWLSIYGQPQNQIEIT